MNDYAVNMRHITKRFGELVANDRISFKLRRGSIHGLLGENGAGKTTLMNILYGLYQAEEGEIFIDGGPVRIDSPSQAIELGIGMVHQDFMLVCPFSVAENIILGLPSEREPFLDLKKAEKRITDLSRRYKLRVDPTAKIWQLSVGEQQRVEIVSTIYRGAKILILDEPTSVLTPQECHELFEFLKIMRGDGKSVIFITHKLEEVLQITDEISVLRDGKLIDTVKTNETNRTELTKMMVGRDVLFRFAKSEVKPGSVTLKVEKLEALNSKGLPALKQVSFEVREREILGIAGVDGNGQKELCEVLTGLRPLIRGKISVNGMDLTNQPPRKFIQNHIAYIPEDRIKRGLVMNFDLMKNFIIKDFSQPRFARHGFLNFATIREKANQLVSEYQIKTSGITAKAKSLSGGNLQKVILAREFSGQPKVLIANQPTRGLDISATEYVRRRLLEERDQGVAVLLISADLEEIFQLFDRIAVIYEGEIMGIMNRDEAKLEEVGLMMAGVRQGAGK